MGQQAWEHAEILKRLARIEEKIDRRVEMDNIASREQMQNTPFCDYHYRVTKEMEEGVRLASKGKMINGVRRYSRTRIQQLEAE